MRSELTREIDNEHTFECLLCGDCCTGEMKIRLKGLCSLHPGNKPLICKLAPVGRVIDFENESEGYLLTPPTSSCPGNHEAKRTTV